MSESTLRRDLEYWQGRGSVKRTHGGAVSATEVAELPPLEDRTGTRTAEKQQIARLVAGLIEDGDAVLLDGGTTTLEVARALADRPLQVVTNSVPIAQVLANSRDTELILIGGYVYPKTGVAIGPLAIDMMKQVHVRYTVMSVSGVTTGGLYNSNLLLVETQRQMMRCADQVVIAADSGKFGRQSLALLCELGAVDRVVTDAGVPPEFRAALEAAGVRLTCAGESP